MAAIRMVSLTAGPSTVKSSRSVLIGNRASFLCTKAPMPRIPNEVSPRPDAESIGGGGFFFYPPPPSQHFYTPFCDHTHPPRPLVPATLPRLSVFTPSAIVGRLYVRMSAL